MTNYNELDKSELQYFLDQTAIINHMKNSSLVQNSKLVQLHKITGRKDFAKSHLGNGPHEARFLNINKSPAILSSTKKVSYISLQKTTGRKVKSHDKYRTNVFYDPNFRVVQPNLSGAGVDYNLSVLNEYSRNSTEM
jgi:hypothetical protein